MNNLQNLVFIGDLRATAPYSSPLSTQPIISLAAARGDMGMAQAGPLMEMGDFPPTTRITHSGGASGGSAAGSRGSGGAGSGGSGNGGSPAGSGGSGLGLARGSVLSMLQGLTTLQTLVLEQWPDHIPGAGEWPAAFVLGTQ